MILFPKYIENKTRWNYGISTHFFIACESGVYLPIYFFPFIIYILPLAGEFPDFITFLRHHIAQIENQ